MPKTPTRPLEMVSIVSVSYTQSLQVAWVSIYEEATAISTFVKVLNFVKDSFGTGHSLGNERPDYPGTKIRISD